MDPRGAPPLSDFVLDASLTLQWLFEDEAGRQYALGILSTLSSNRAVVPRLWFYEVGNGLVMAERRKRITVSQIDQFLSRLKALPIEVAHEDLEELFALPLLAQRCKLTNYDAAYLALALRLHLPLATSDIHLKRAAEDAGVITLSS